MSVWLRRVKADYDKMRTYFTEKSKIRILKTIGNPPEKYQIEFLVTSLQKDAESQQLRAKNSFIAEIVLTRAYPRMAPQCKMLTPVFHPNIAPHAICIGDHWAAGESLPYLVVRIAEMLSFQSYNIKSPLNGEAARWADKNQRRLPLDKFDFSSLLSAGESVGRRKDGAAKASGACGNCGKTASVQNKLVVCLNQHVACQDCILNCSACESTLCLGCTLNKCGLCGKSVCHQCIVVCQSCNRKACKNDCRGCHVCRHPNCKDCLVGCTKCRQAACIQHIKKVQTPQGAAYVCSSCGA